MPPLPFPWRGVETVVPLSNLATISKKVSDFKKQYLPVPVLKTDEVDTFVGDEMGATNKKTCRNGES